MRRRLATMLAFAMMPAVIFSIAEGISRHHQLTEERNEAFFGAAVVDAQATRDVFVGLRAVATTIALDPDVAAFREPACSGILGRAVAANPLFRLAVAIDAEGSVRCASRPVEPGTSFASDPGFRAIASDPDFGLDVRGAGRVTGEEVVIGAAPLLAEGGFGGVVSISVAASSLRFLVRTGGDATERRPFRAILARDGTVLLDTENHDRAGAWLPRADIAPRLGFVPDSFTAESVDGSERFYSVSPFVRGKAWLIAASDERALLDDATLRVLPAMVTPLIVLAIAVGVAYVALDRLVLRHIVYLSRLTRAYGRGRLDLKPRLEDGAPQEIARLAATLGAMAGSLAERQRELRASAETNRVLLLEVYHRVRNNLQMVASLLNLQAQRGGAGPELRALDRTRDRIHSLALVHERLYESGAVDRLDLARLLGDVARAVLGPGGRGAGLRLSLDLDPRTEAPARATPLALFLNEAMVNAVGLAGPPDGPPDGAAEVRVALRAGPGGALTLTVASDAGPRSAPAQDEALESRLMERFAHQLRARLTRGREGARRVVTLEIPPAAAIAA